MLATNEVIFDVPAEHLKIAFGIERKGSSKTLYSFFIYKKDVHR